mgnify:CR=1 FL=1|tara:strand:- start:306 stop:1124 length:819 start_codon:yes stop_codon:yes gene_type:complete
MNIFNKILLNLFSKTLKKNTKFKDLHKGKSCYLFGNGSSLKYYDLKLFNDRASIGCGAFFAHKDFKDLNLKYYYVSHPLFFHKFWKNPYSKRYEKNKVGEFYRKKMSLFPEAQYFTSLSNYFGIQGDNINYVYHFGQVDELSVDSQMDEIFSMMEGSLMGMIGVALYLGFTDITLVGCDYTFAPKMQGHFYERGPEKRREGTAFLGKTLNLIKDKVTISTITPDEDFRGDVLPSITYKELTGNDPVYKDNSKIVSEANLKQLDSLNMQYRIY